MTNPELDQPEKPQLFAGRELAFRFCRPDFLDDDRKFMAWLEECRQMGGAAIVYIDQRDAPYTPDPLEQDAGFHYALLGAIRSYPPTSDVDFFEASNIIIPLPIFAHIMGWAKPAEEENLGPTDYQLTCDFLQVVQFLNEAFEGRVFFGSREKWETEATSKQILGAPQACAETIDLLDYLGRNPDEIDEPGVLELLAEIRGTNIQSLKEQEFVTEEELIQIMKRTVGVRKLGYPQPPRTSEGLKNYWIR